MIRLRRAEKAVKGARSYSYWSGSHRWNAPKPAAASASTKPSTSAPKEEQPEQAKEQEQSQASTSALPIEQTPNSVSANQPASADEPSHRSQTIPKQRPATTASKPHLPAVPILNVHPNVINIDRLFAGDRPLLEVRIPKAKRRSASPIQQQAKKSNVYLDEMTGESMDALEGFHLGPEAGPPKNSAVSSFLARQTAFRPPPLPTIPIPTQAPTEKEKKLAFLSPFTKSPTPTKKHPQSETFLSSRFSTFLKRAHSKLNSDEQIALDAFFHTSDDKPLSKLKLTAEKKAIKDEGLSAALAAAKKFISLLPDMPSSNFEGSGIGQGKAFRLIKDGKGGWKAEELDMNALGAEHEENVAFIERLDANEEMGLEEEGVEVIDLSNAEEMNGGGVGGQLHGLLNMLQKAFTKPGSEPQDVMLSQESAASMMLEDAPQTGRRGTGRRITLGPRSISKKGPRSVRMIIRMDSVKRKRKTKMSKHKYKKRRKAQKALRRKQGKGS